MKKIFVCFIGFIIFIATIYTFTSNLNNNYMNLDYHKTIKRIEVILFKKVNNRSNNHDTEKFTVEDKSDINNIINYINCIDLLKKEKSLNTQDYSFIDITLYYEYKNEEALSKNSSNYDSIVISNNHLFFFEDPKWDGDYNSYSIKKNKNIKEIYTDIKNICPNIIGII